MRPGLPISLLVHAALAAAGYVTFGAPAPDLSRALIIPVDLVADAPRTQIRSAAPEPQDDGEPSFAPEPNPEASAIIEEPLPDAPPPPTEPEPIALPEPAPEPEPKPEPIAKTDPTPPAESPPRPRRRLDLGDLERAVTNAAPSERRNPPPGRQSAPATGPAARGPSVDDGLTLAEEDALRESLRGCWRAPADMRDPGRLIVEVRFWLNADGTISRGPNLISPSNVPAGDIELRVAADNALRAVRECAPYKLPPERYETWKQITFRFDPRAMATW